MKGQLPDNAPSPTSARTGFRNVAVSRPKPSSAIAVSASSIHSTSASPTPRNIARTADPHARSLFVNNNVLSYGIRPETRAQYVGDCRSQSKEPSIADGRSARKALGAAFGVDTVRLLLCGRSKRELCSRLELFDWGCDGSWAGKIPESDRTHWQWRGRSSGDVWGDRKKRRL